MQPYLLIDFKPLLDLRRDKMPFFYPYAPAFDLFQVDCYTFLFTVEFGVEPSLIVYPYKRLKTKQSVLIPIIIPLRDVMPNKYISVLKVAEITMNKHIEHLVDEILFLIGDRGGRLLYIQFRPQERTCRLMGAFNKLVKKENFLNRATSYLLSPEEGYPCWVPKTVRLVRLSSRADSKRKMMSTGTDFRSKTRQSQYAFSYLVGNVIILMKKMVDIEEMAMQHVYQRFDWGKLSEEKELIGLSEYEFQRNQKLRRCSSKSKHIARLQFSDSVGGYVECDWENKPVLAVAFSMRCGVLLLDLSTFEIAREVSLSSGIRSIQAFQCGHTTYLALLLYENYFILLDHLGKYSKILGHRSFISGLSYCDGIVYATGMDGALSVSNLEMAHEALLIRGVWLLGEDVAGRQPQRLFGLCQARSETNAEFGLGGMMVTRDLLATTSYQCRVKLYDLADLEGEEELTE